MRHFKNFGDWLRLFGVIGLVGIMLTGITYAALQSQHAVLASSTVESATAALVLSKDGATYSSNAVGYDFSGLVPGGPAMPSAGNGQPLWLKNSGSAALNATLQIITSPTTTGGVDLSKVSIILTPVNPNGSFGTPQAYTIAALLAATTGLPVNPAPFTASYIQPYKVQVQMAADAFSGSNATISGLDLVFAGTAATP